jgi:hypothetical protein
MQEGSSFNKIRANEPTDRVLIKTAKINGKKNCAVSQGVVRAIYE